MNMWQLDWSKLAEVLTYNAKQPMIFSSGLFLFLFLGFSLIYMLLQKKDTARILFVTLFSYYFYYKSSGFYFFLLGVVTVTDFLLAGRMANTETQWKRMFLLLASLGINLGLLCYFKYTNFFYEMLAPLWHGTYHPLDIFLPVGISFFTFQSLSYTIDVYRKDLKPLSNLLDYVFYVSFFPQLVAGPIVRARDFIPQIRQPLYVSPEMFGQGVFFIVSGLFKKAVISDYISVNFVERIFDNPGLYSGLENLFGVYGYALQIYCDFSGYSDMAIGIGEFFGITLPENFEYPYLACSVGEYWRRWHISLSSWFRDYVYIPLGGSRCRLRRTCLNLLIVFALTGLWHGAAWQYVVFGLLHGIILCMERLGLRRALEQLPRLFRHLYTVVLLWLTLVIFGAPGLSEGLAVLKGIFTWQSGAKGYTLAAFADTKLLLILAASFLLCGPVQALCPKLKAALYAKKAPSPAGMAGLLVLLFLGLMRVTAGTYSAFIYFQF